MRFLAAALLLVVGAATAVATVALHELSWGLPFGLVTTAAVVVAVPAGWSRLGFVVGWDAMVGWLAFPRPEGDYVLSQDLPGYVVLGAGLVLLVLGVATLPQRRRTGPDAPSMASMTARRSLPDREREGGWIVLLMLAVLVLLAGGGYAALHHVAEGKVPPGVTVAGVDVGGRTPAAAERALRAGLADREDDAVTFVVDGEKVSIGPEDAGLSVDYAASVAAAGASRSWRPEQLWDYWTRSDDLDAVVDVDEAAFDDALDRLADRVGTAPKDGAVRFRRGEIVTVDPENGETFDRQAAREAILTSYLSGDSVPLDVPTVVTHPRIDEADVRHALDTFANPAMSSAVTLVLGRREVRLQPREFSRALAMRPDGGRLVPHVRAKVLARLVGTGVSRGRPVDARVELRHGKPTVIPARRGVRYERDDIARTLLRALTRHGDRRRGEVEATVARPDFTTAEARALKIRERVSTFTTYYSHADYRNVNIGRAAELVDGTVLKPGDVFSLNRIVGERTRANGFTKGFVIDDGIYAEDLGGGVSQLATTTFNAMFFAGLEDVEHKPHSFYIDRYPVGREATVAWGSVDLRFRNDTPYGVLVHATVTPSTPTSPGVVTVSMWSTKYWDISSTTSDRYDFRPPETRVLRSPDCYPHTGYDGFDVDVTRIFRHHGHDKVVRTEKFHTSYTPSDTVVCR